MSKYSHRLISGTHDVKNCWCMKSAPMTSEALREAVADKIAEYTGTPDGPTKYVIAQQILQLIATSLEKKYTLKTGLLWDSQDATDGYNQAIDDFLKLLGGGDNG